jgi:hypothetical protein
LAGDGVNMNAKCLSFHETEHPVTHFPHKR